MDESLFPTFLDDQRAVLAEVEALVNTTETGITRQPGSAGPAGPRARAALLAQNRLLRTRFDDVCRRLADAYVASDAGQRAVMRRLVQGLPGVNACMGIPSELIRARIDGPRFRLALVLESIKDLQPDARDAIDRLDTLCRAASTAGIDPRPAVQEIASVSSDIDHSGLGSMREVLLARLIVAAPLSIGSAGDGGPMERAVPTATYLPTPTLLRYLAIAGVMTACALMTFAQIGYTLQTPGYHATRGAWSCKVVIFLLCVTVLGFRASLVGAVRWLRSSPPPGVTWTQGLLVIAMVFGTMAVLIGLLALFARDLGW